MVKRRISKKELKISKGMKGLPKSGWLTVIEDNPLGYIPKRSRQKTFGGSLIDDLHIDLLNPRIKRYKDLRKEGKTIW